jgi:AraC-like DNA-binding protein
MKPALFYKIQLPENKVYDIVKVTLRNFVVPWHFHPEIEIMLITKGKGTRFVGDSIESFEPFDLVMVGSNLAHVWKNSQEHYLKETSSVAECIYIVFRHDSFGKDFFEIPEMHRIRELLTRSERGIKFGEKTKEAVIDKILEASQLTGVNQFISLIGILNILSTSDDYSYLSTIGFNGKIESFDLQRLNRVLEYVMSNFRNDIKLEDVASVANMSTTSFCRYFKSRTNKTVMRFINEIRIGYAHKMLVETQYNVEQICYECGFKNVSNFYEQFQKITRKSPFRYRKEHSERVF